MEDHSLFSQLRLADAALYGLPGDVVRTLSPSTEADPAALLMQYLVMFGSAVGAGPYLERGGRHPGRLHALLVGDAAEGRKGTAGDAIEPIFRRADRQWFHDRITYGLQSSEALIRLLDDRTVSDRRLLVYEPEFARLLATMRTGTKVPSVIKAAWDGKPLEAVTRDPRASLRATRPHVSIIAHVQPSVLADRMPAVELESGLASRFLYVVVQRHQLLPFGGATDPGDIKRLAGRTGDALDAAFEFTLEGLDPITRRLHEIYATEPFRKLSTSPDFEIHWRGLYGYGERGSGWEPGELNMPAPGILNSIVARAAQHVIRLAVVYALADGSRIVDVPHLDAAIALWRYCYASANAVFGSITGNPDLDRVIKALDRSPRRQLSRTEISGLFGRHRSVRQLDALTAELLESGRATLHYETTAGRPAAVYTLCELAKDAKDQGRGGG